MKPIDGYFNWERSRQANAMCDMLRKDGLGINELSLLKILARKMGRKTTTDGQIKNGCRASLDTLERESLLERRAIGKALARLVEKGYITKTLDRHRRVAGELTKEGQRREDMGIPTDASHIRKPLGRPRKDGSSAAQWQHCIYHAVVEVWDSITFPDKKGDAEPVVRTEVSAEERAAADTLDVPQTRDVTVEDETRPVSIQDLNQIYKYIYCYFSEHETFDKAKNPRGAMDDTCKVLGQLAMGYSNEPESAGDFLDYLCKHQPTEVHRLMEKLNYKKTKEVEFLGGANGLILSAECYWEKFVEFDLDRRAAQINTEYEQADEEPVSVGAGYEELGDELE